MWRKALQVCKYAATLLFTAALFSASADSYSNTSADGNKIVTTTTTGAAQNGRFTITQGNAQTMSMPTISSPTMPSVSSPSIGGDYYMPGSSSFYSGSAPSSSTNSQGASSSAPTAVSSMNAEPMAGSSSNSASANSTAAANSTAGNAASSKQAAQNISSLLSSSNALSALGLSGSSLTASDLSTLDGMGALGSVSSLLAGSGTSAYTKNASLLGTTQDSATLQQILTQLSDLKKQIASSQQNSSSSANTASYRSGTTAEPRILRFLVNGYDVLATCRSVYFSKKENDGTFLLTGDRKYASDGKTRSETFYLLFHATGSRSGTTSYTVTPAVSQDYQNDYSFLYQLTKKTPLTAERTGNLVTMRVNQSDWNLDLLLDVSN
jgi:hypothetical protein